MILLSILIPTTDDRFEMFGRLRRYLQCLAKPYAGEIEILDYCDDRSISVGAKRDALYNAAKGKYSWQIDDDDMISLSSIDQIMKIILLQDPDCITFKERCIMDGKLYSCNHSLIYDDWADNFDGYDFVRTPYFKDVIRTSIAKSIRVPDMRYGEDHQWSKELKPCLETETHIDDYLYYYEHISSDFITRYGFDKD